MKWAISKRRRKEGGFNGFEIIKKDIEKGTEKIRVGLKPLSRIIAREGVKIFSEKDEEIGIITSGTFGPSVKLPVAMGYINSKFSEEGTKIKILIRDKLYEAKVCKLPFYKKVMLNKNFYE